MNKVLFVLACITLFPMALQAGVWSLFGNKVYWVKFKEFWGVGH